MSKIVPAIFPNGREAATRLYYDFARRAKPTGPAAFMSS
jgi:hypothetical protein